MGQPRKEAAERLGRETRREPHRMQRWRLLLGYPAGYRVGMSSLGLLTLHREVCARPGWSAERVFLPDRDGTRTLLRALESGDSAARFHAVGISVAHELEVAAAAELLHWLGLPPRRRDRQGGPLVVLGGPLTSINPRPLAPLADLVIVGEADRAIHRFCDALERATDLDALVADTAGEEGFWWPAEQASPPEPLRVPAAALPAHSAIWSQDAALANMALVEVSRGCDRACAFCSTSRPAAGRCRTVGAEGVLAAIPEQATRVGLVGAAVSDHPELAEILTSIVGSGREVGISSVRADRLSAELLDLLARGGLRTLTLGVDGASERLRREIKKGVTADHLREAARLAANAGLRRLKLYQILGLPDEQDADLDEFIALVDELSRILPVTVTLSPFVPKPRTPLADAPQHLVKEVDRRLRYVRTGLRGRVRMQPSSARWAWVEAQIARGDASTGEAILEAWDQGGSFAHFKRALGADR